MKSLIRAKAKFELCHAPSQFDMADVRMSLAALTSDSRTMELEVFSARCVANATGASGAIASLTAAVAGSKLTVVRTTASTALERLVDDYLIACKARGLSLNTIETSYGYPLRGICCPRRHQQALLRHSFIGVG